MKMLVLLVGAVALLSAQAQGGNLGLHPRCCNC
jgi:hypothetical protein